MSDERSVTGVAGSSTDQNGIFVSPGSVTSVLWPPPIARMLAGQAVSSGVAFAAFSPP
jgi:hypothetical protein